MERYRGEGLTAGFSAAVIANDALGNYVVSTILLQMLRRAGADRVGLVCGNRVGEFLAAQTLSSGSSDDNKWDWNVALWGNRFPEQLGELSAELPDLVINMESSPVAMVVASLLSRRGYVAGPCAGDEGRGILQFPDDAAGRLWSDPDWTANDLCERHPFLESGFIGEILCRSSYLEGPIPNYSVPSANVDVDIPDVLIATSASLPEKLWSTEKWIAAVEYLKGLGMSVGLLGAKPSESSRYWLGRETEDRLVGKGLAQDLRGAFTLPQVVGAIKRCRLVLTLDNGILHLACSARRPVVGMYRHGIHRLWAPPWSELRVVVGDENTPVSQIPLDKVFAAVDSIQ